MNFQAAWSDYRETNRGKEAIAIFDKLLNDEIDEVGTKDYHASLSNLLKKYYEPQLRKYNYSDEDEIVEELGDLPFYILSLLDTNFGLSIGKMVILTSTTLNPLHGLRWRILITFVH